LVLSERHWPFLVLSPTLAAALHLQAVLDAGGLPALLSCMETCERVSLKKEIIWALSNVAAGTSDQVAAMAQAGACVCL